MRPEIACEVRRIGGDNACAVVVPQTRFLHGLRHNLVDKPGWAYSAAVLDEYIEPPSVAELEASASGPVAVRIAEIRAIVPRAA